MPRDGSLTRNKIMDVAQQMVLSLGLSGTSVEKVIEGAGVTRGTFFYHFKTKHDLAASLIGRYADEDRVHFDAAFCSSRTLFAPSTTWGRAHDAGCCGGKDEPTAPALESAMRHADFRCAPWKCKALYELGGRSGCRL